MRLELVRISQQVVAVHREIFIRKAALRNALSQLARKPASVRLVEQQEFMRRSGSQRSLLNRLGEKLQTLQDQRQEKNDQYDKLRRAREALEKLREQAASEHARTTGKLEQKEMEDSFRLSLARGITERRAAAESGVKHER